MVETVDVAVQYSWSLMVGITLCGRFNASAIFARSTAAMGVETIRPAAVP